MLDGLPQHHDAKLSRRPRRVRGDFALTKFRNGERRRLKDGIGSTSTL
jgi:hypothetical protein